MCASGLTDHTKDNFPWVCDLKVEIAGSPIGGAGTFRIVCSARRAVELSPRRKPCGSGTEHTKPRNGAEDAGTALRPVPGLVTVSANPMAYAMG